MTLQNKVGYGMILSPWLQRVILGLRELRQLTKDQMKFLDLNQVYARSLHLPELLAMGEGVSSKEGY